MHPLRPRRLVSASCRGVGLPETEGRKSGDGRFTEDGKIQNSRRPRRRPKDEAGNIQNPILLPLCRLPDAFSTAFSWQIGDVIARIPHHLTISRWKFDHPAGKIRKILFEIHAATDFSPVHRIANAIYSALKEYSLYPPMRKAGDVFLINLSPTTLYHEITLTEGFIDSSAGNMLRSVDLWRRYD